MPLEFATEADWAGGGYGMQDNGQRLTGPGGMLKELTGKPDPTLIPSSFILRLAAHMGRGARKYARNNWMKASSRDELEGFQASAFRHLLAWIDGLEDEDHAAAVCANIFMAEHLKDKLKEEAS